MISQSKASLRRPAINLGFIVKRPGMLSLVQDEGRYGAFNVGLTNGGPIDKLAFHWANRLCNNALNVSAIEVSVGGFAIIAQVDAVIAVTGADMPLTINGQVKTLWRSYQVKAGDLIELGFTNLGMRSYFAVAGGFNITPSFGSTATVCREGIGGLKGKKLAANDILPCVTTKDSQLVSLSIEDQPKYSQEVLLRIIPSYQQHHFSVEQQKLFFSSEYSVGKSFDRMGYRLEGQKIVSDINGILSEGICHGAVQIPSDGQPIVLMNDRQTIGGYPKIGAVISIDTAKLGQLSQGGKVRFAPITMEKARELILEDLSLFEQTQVSVCD
ncbi:biotin-dependent carboxyltransferase [Colwellia sp. BRX8-4]|uniref:5-oxoprolinase subunit C family protein n=1 Tax=unclassified Colwellia TaxID=196834 RepID=UPI0015F5C6D3|nr:MULTISPECIES: biotin-dependent carboxyltransferase family protein [unclassified Colwellia]MBA6352702.1 biotin-dependent carboxyltransferase [Colwellia sp. BRX9-1]MBA6363826.1 biotin-dependent carboxyltransferase [Colwellia sp. BRX8-8]MBA6372721.1 biotin-dependent carboxyltransferase [Colwellia sp. BRX8-4]